MNKACLLTISPTSPEFQSILPPLAPDDSWLSVFPSGVGLSGADRQFVPADHPLPHVDLIQPDVGLSYERLLQKLPSTGHQEELRKRRRRAQWKKVRQWGKAAKPALPNQTERPGPGVRAYL